VKGEPCEILRSLIGHSPLALSLTIDQSQNKTSSFEASAQATDSQVLEDVGIPPGPCTPPDKITGSIEETAWRLWVALTCPVNHNVHPYVIWENWIEQAQMYPLNPAKVLQIPASLAHSSSAPHLLHASPLALAKNPGIEETVPGLLGAAEQNCNTAQAPPDNQKNLIICEEVRQNGATQDYIAGTVMWNRNGQKRLAASHAEIQFPRPTIEVKADWIHLSSIGFDCANLPPVCAKACISRRSAAIVSLLSRFT
jgi:hypothetical protein